MTKLLKFLLIFLIADIVAVFYLKKSEPTIYPDEIIYDPYFLPELENKVIDKQILIDMGIVSWRSSWIYYSTFPLLYYWTNFTKDLENYLPKTNFGIVSYDSLVSGEKVLLADASFGYENGKLVKYAVKMKNGRRNRCEYNYNQGELYFESACFDNYTMIMSDTGLVQSDSVVKRTKKKKGDLRHLTAYYTYEQEHSFTENLFWYDSVDGRLSHLDVSRNWDTIKVCQYEYNDDGSLKRVYTKGRFLSLNFIEHEYDPKSKVDVLKKMGRNESQTVYVDSANADSIKIRIVNEQESGVSDTFDIVRVNKGAVELVSSSRVKTLARVEHLTEGNFQRDLFLNENLDTIGWFKREYGVLTEMAMTLSSYVFDHEKDGFRVFRIAPKFDRINKRDEIESCNLDSVALNSIQWSVDIESARYNDVVLYLDSEKFVIEHDEFALNDEKFMDGSLTFSTDKKYVRVISSFQRISLEPSVHYTYFALEQDTLRKCTVTGNLNSELFVKEIQAKLEALKEKIKENGYEDILKKSDL